MSDTRATIAFLNGLSMHAISRCEKYLRSLPREGTPCDIKVCKPLSGENCRGTGDVVASKCLKIRDEPRPLTLSPKKGKVLRNKNLPIIKNRSIPSDEAKSKSDSDESSKKKKKKEKCDDKKGKSSAKPEAEKILKKPKTPIVEEEVENAESPKREPPKIACKVLTDQIRVHPILTCAGVILELDVEVTVPSGDVKKMKLSIECPDFKPKRIKVGGKWKEIV